MAGVGHGPQLSDLAQILQQASHHACVMIEMDILVLRRSKIDVNALCVAV
jgi:hypothetical protein